jgi:hypothetical protein
MLDTIRHLKHNWIVIIFLGFSLTLASILFPVEVKSRTDAIMLQFGQPIAFVSQNQGSLPTSSRYWEVPPFDSHRLIFSNEYLTTVSITPFLLDFVINSVLVGVLICFVAYYTKRPNRN